MKIKMDFVTNSSSTSFVIITKGKLDKKSFLELVGIGDESPFVTIFDNLYDRLIENMVPISDRKSYWENTQGKQLKKMLEADYSDEVVEKMIDAKKAGRNVYVGELSSESDVIESFFCCESFELENKGIYFNGLDCAW